MKIHAIQTGLVRIKIGRSWFGSNHPSLRTWPETEQVIHGSALRPEADVNVRYFWDLSVAKDRRMEHGSVN